jgi:hypothetical protein
MQPEHRKQLLSISARLDQALAQADEILSEPVYADVATMADELRELLVDMQAKVEDHLDHKGAL